ncbi:hypothetical protein Tco_1175027 [Tanacetum coccineum]
MDLYHSRLTPDDLNDLIIKYKILRDLHPRLPLEDFVMSELSDDAIGIYHRMFVFSGDQIPFSSFHLALIKHYRVHFSQLGPLGLNKVITFEVLCRSLQIEPTMTLFRVFQTLCKQGDWFSFAKRPAPSPVCIDDNRSCMKHWKSGFFFIDRRAILDAMVWRHPNAAIDDLRPAVGSFNMADVRRLSAHVIKLRDMPEGVLVLSGLSHIWKSRVYDSVLRGADRNGIGLWVFMIFSAFLSGPVLRSRRSPIWMIFSVGTPSSKIDAKANASQKQKAYTSCATSSHVAKRTRSALAQSSGSTMCPSLFVGDDDESDDDDACVEILLVTPLRSAAVIPSLGNQGKGVMVDDVVAPSTSVSRPRPSSGPAPSFRDISGDAIHTDFFPFSGGPYYTTYPGDGVAGNCFKDPVVCKIIVDQFPTPGEMAWIESLSDDQLTTKMSVLHCIMMSHGGELLARYRRLNQSHHEYVLSADSRLKGYEEKVANMTGLKLQVAALKKQVSGLTDKLTSSDASFSKSKAKGKERKKKIRSLTKSLDNLHAEVACISADLNRATILEAKKDEEILHLKATPLEVQGELLSLDASTGLAEASSLVAQIDYAFLNKITEHATKPISVILQLEPEKLTRPANVPTSRDARVSPPIAKESIVTPASKSLELSTNVAPAPSAITLEQNKEWGTSHALDDVAEVTVVGSERVSSGPNDVVVALFAGEKGDGLTPSSVAGEEAAVNPSRV